MSLNASINISVDSQLDEEWLRSSIGICNTVGATMKLNLLDREGGMRLDGKKRETRK